MTLTDIYQQFEHCKFWEDRYRLLIQFSRQLPTPSELERASWQEITGCESQLWFAFQPSPREVKGYSDARLMQGLLFIIQTALLEKPENELADFDIQQLFDDLQITRHLTSTRLNGLKQIEGIVRAASAV